MHPVMSITNMIFLDGIKTLHALDHNCCTLSTAIDCVAKVKEAPPQMHTQSRTAKPWSYPEEPKGTCANGSKRVRQEDGPVTTSEQAKVDSFLVFFSAQQAAGLWRFDDDDAITRHQLFKAGHPGARKASKTDSHGRQNSRLGGDGDIALFTCTPASPLLSPSGSGVLTPVTTSISPYNCQNLIHSDESGQIHTNEPEQQRQAREWSERLAASWAKGSIESLGRSLG